jgi:MoaA/NifB/PqqE/SkfB family radical SAM enzyme
MLEHDVKQFSSDKILKHLDRIHDWLQGGNPYPITMELDMTNVCSHNCPECVSGYFKRANRDTLTRELAERIIRELAECGIRGLIFTGGGEPLSHPDTPAMLALARELGMDVALITHGSLLDECNMPAILGACTWVRVSLDAITPASFQAMHGLGEKAFHKVVENIQRLARTKKELSSSCTVGVGFLTCETTVGEVVEAARTCKEWGVDYLQFRPVQIHRGGCFEYHWADVDEQIDEACKYSGDGYEVLYSKHKYEAIKCEDYGRNYGKCYGQQFASTIGADGKVYVCCHLRGFDHFCLGDLHTQSFKEIWNSEQRRKAVERIGDFRHCIPLCRDNTFNQILWNIKQPRNHRNFL